MAAADELYSVRPDEFVARRSSLVLEAKESGDKALAEEIKRLAKPNTAAWVVNVLVREQSEQLEQVLGLGAALREAQASMAGEELRELGRQRRHLTAAVTRQARSLASELGQRVNDPVAAQVEDTLHAAMIDEDAAKAVRTGMLIKPLAVSGTEVVDVVEAVALPSALGETAVRPSTPRKAGRKQEPHKPELTVVEDSSRAVEEAESALADAEGELANAERRLAKAVEKVEKREAKGLQLNAELEELRRRVAELEQRVDSNEDELSDAEEARDAREESVEEARRAVERARKALQALR